MSDTESPTGADDLLRPAEPVSWPAGRSAAAAFTFDVDAESAALSASWDMAERPSGDS